jgi:3-oxoacyl-[acyl-carrier-protein] synthase-3
VVASEIRVLSAGAAVPGPPVGTAELARCFGMDDLWQQWVDTFIGTRTRHLAVDLRTGRRRDTLADLAERAAADALAAAGRSAQDVDVVVMGTATPDELMPATVNVVADRLRIDGVPTFQLQSGCAGAVQAIDVAAALLHTGRYRTALVLGGDVIAKHYDVHADLRAVPPEELVNYVLFGDGAGACVLSTEEQAGAPVLRAVLTRLVGLDRAPGQELRWYGSADRPDELRPAREDYKAIEESVPRLAAEIVEELLDDLGWDRSGIDYLLPPQLSATMTATIVRGLDLPGAKEISCVDRIGNNGNALLFFQLAELLPVLTPATRALAVAVESSKWIKGGIALES